MDRPGLVFMGTPLFAIESLRACLEVGTVLAVVTQPDRPRGRGQALQASPVKDFAVRAGLPILQPERIRGTDFAGVLRGFGADAAVVTAYGKILPEDVLSAPRRGCLNVHASLLPRWRGAAPVQWAIASGDAETGVCLMQMDAGMDTGPVLACRRERIRPDDTSASLHERLAVLGGELLREALPTWLAGALPAVPQPGEGATLAPRVEKADGRIDWRRSAAVLERRIRAFSPWPGGWTETAGGLLKVHRVEAGSGRGDPGMVLSIQGGLEVACGEGSLCLREVQREGGRRMRAEDFLAGHALRPGDRPFLDPEHSP